MTTRMKIAFWCYALTAFVTGIFGLIYLLRGQYMPFHAAALGIEWSDVPSNVQAVILATMRATGGAWVGLAFITAVLLVGPFRDNVRWARWAIPATGILGSAGALYAAVYLHQTTGAQTLWPLALALLCLNVIGILMTYLDEYRS